MALPNSVRPKNQRSASTASAAPPSTHRLCGTIVAGPMAIGALPEGRQRVDALVPQHLGGAAQEQRHADGDDDQRHHVGVPAERRAGSIASFCTATPTTAAASTARGTAAHSGSRRRPAPPRPCRRS
jgi:hypothetical protein